MARGGDGDVRGGAASVVGQHVHTEVAVVVMLAALAISLGLRRTRGLRHSESRERRLGERGLRGFPP